METPQLEEDDGAGGVRKRRMSVAMMEALASQGAGKEAELRAEREAQISVLGDAAAAAEASAVEKAALAEAAAAEAARVAEESSALPQSTRQVRRRRSSIAAAEVSKVQAENAAEEARLAKVHLAKLEQAQRMSAIVGAGPVLLQDLTKKKKFAKRWVVIDVETVTLFAKKGASKPLRVVLRKAIKGLNSPSADLEAHVKYPDSGVDVCFVDVTLTCVPVAGDGESAKVVDLLAKLEPNSAARTMDSEGNPIQILEVSLLLTKAAAVSRSRLRRRRQPCTRIPFSRRHPLPPRRPTHPSARAVRSVRHHAGELSFIYRYILRESCSQFDSLPLTSLTKLYRPRAAPCRA